ncbi:MAG: hypothetical protein HOC71_16500 [Candidatus Latescibacteria bacterium]|jgi:hypothetical protein|nr:hypothetical protein [Candidatus Latescibacterota bacterium]
MKRFAPLLHFLLLFLLSISLVKADNIYELRKLTEDDWLDMSTEDRLRALSTSTRHAENQEFMGDFGRYHNLYKKWGYEFYEMEDRYETYAFRGFEAYNLLEEQRNRWSYNEFGDRIARMRHSAVIWKDRYYEDGAYQVWKPSGFINDSGVVDGVWVMKESTDDWSFSAIGAGSLRTGFTPLTLSIPNMNGISLDFMSANSSFKIVSSSLYQHLTDITKEGGIILRGGRYRRKLGVLTLGASYVKTYGVQGDRERGSEWRGTISNGTFTPIMVAVRFLDDSPEDREGGPVVYDLKLKINGRYRDNISPQIIMDDIRRDRTSAITDKIDNQYIEPKPQIFYAPPTFDYFGIGKTPLLKYSDYFYLNDLIKGANLANTSTKYSKSLSNSYYSLAELSGKPLQADGTEAIIFIFDLASCTEKINDIEAVATVANDYLIQTSMIYVSNPNGGHDSSGKNSDWYDTTYWRKAAQAEGNIKDGSNIRTVNFNFGYEVANEVWGFDADFNYKGFKIKAEYVTNTHTYMFADGLAGAGKPISFVAGLAPRTGHRFSQSDHAYYVTAEKDWGKFGFAGEIFKMGKYYRPYMDYFTSNVAMSTSNALMRSNNTARVSVIEDNDDDDQYPDQMLVRRVMGNIESSEDPDGVFPGNDTDNDGIPDTNKNINEIPDSDEPFLMFDSDPDEFVFGNDYNNNTIPDFREDDMKFDTPYELDRQGHHLLVKYSPQQSINFAVGSMKTKGVGASSNRTGNDYFKFLVNYNVFNVGQIYAEYRYEKIQDNIRDQYIQVKRSLAKQQYSHHRKKFDRDLFYDELEYRNSNVHRLWIESTIRALPSITLENNVKIERNGQIEGIMYDNTFQPHDQLDTIALMNKIVFTKRWGNIIFSPGIKFRLYKKVRSESLQPLDHDLARIPLITVKYVISPRSDIMLGLQGIPGFQYSYSNYVQSQNDFRRRTYVLQFQNRTDYFGYNVWAAVGVDLDQVDYKEKYREFEEYQSSGTFVKIYLGW